MQKIQNISFIFLLLLVYSCENKSKKENVKNTSNSSEAIFNNQNAKDYEKLNSYFSTRNLTLCSYYKSIDSIKTNAKIKADKKFPNSLAKHDKFIERCINLETSIFKQKHNIADSISYKAYQIGKIYCD